MVCGSGGVGRVNKRALWRKTYKTVTEAGHSKRGISLLNEREGFSFTVIVLLDLFLKFLQSHFTPLLPLPAESEATSESVFSWLVFFSRGPPTYLEAELFAQPDSVLKHPQKNGPVSSLPVTTCCCQEKFQSHSSCPQGSHPAFLHIHALKLSVDGMLRP